MNSLDDISITDIDIMYLHYHSGYQSQISHRHSYGLLFCIKGQIVFYHNGKEYTCDSNHILLLPRDGDYSLEYTLDGYFSLINFQCTDTFHSDEFLVFHLVDRNTYLKDFEQLQQLALFPRNHAKIMSILYNLISKLNNESQEKDILTPALDYLKLHYADASLNNSLLAQISHISVPYFQKLFRKNLGTSPRQYLQDVRIRKAMVLLTNSDTNITAVAESCGFSSVYHFSRAFKMITGETPSKYRERVKRFKI